MTFSRHQAASIIETALAGDAHCRMYAVVGTPITHSLSPIMHKEVYRKLGLRREFIAVDPEDTSGLERWCDEVRFNDSMGGFCTTIPYKTEVLKWCETLSPIAQRAGAVNTVTRSSDGSLHGDNTDIHGFLYSLKHELQVTLSGSSCAIFGVGGVARAMVVGLIESGVRHITLVARSVYKAEALIETMHWPHNTEFEVVTQLDDKKYDVLINATPLGLHEGDELICTPEILQARGEVLYDAVYVGRGTTRLVQSAREVGMRATDGRLMLVAQGARQAIIWGIEADEALMRSWMLEALQRQEEL